MKPGRVPGLTGDMDIPQLHKIPNDPIQIMDFYINGQNRRMWCDIPNQIPDIKPGKLSDKGILSTLSPGYGLT